MLAFSVANSVVLTSIVITPEDGTTIFTWTLKYKEKTLVKTQGSIAMSKKSHHWDGFLLWAVGYVSKSKFPLLIY